MNIQMSREASARAKMARTLATGLLLVAGMMAALMLVVGPAHASTTFTVNSTGDTLDAKPGDGFCFTGKAQECTLRAAIQEANVTPGTDTINFDIFGTGVKTIRVNSNGNDTLPKITDPVAINGFTQPGATPNSAARGTNAKLTVIVNGAALGPASNGFNVFTSNTTVKGLVINKFPGIGVNINGDSNRIEGNFVGTGASGTEARSNGVGASVSNGSGNIIGGGFRADRNLVSGNDLEGFNVTASNNRIEGNLIGTQKDGRGALGNGGGGVLVDNDANSVSVLGNSIFANGGLGIDLSSISGPDGRTKNDPGDADTGPNNLQNFPVITSASTTTVGTTVKGRLNSETNTPYIIQFFSNPKGTNEGQRLIGQKVVSTDPSGNVSFTFEPKAKVAPGQTITATATRNFFNIPSSTSEFSGPKTVTSA